MTVHQQIKSLLEQRILILDGGMGTLIQSYKLEEKDFRGARFADHPCDVKGNNDLLSLTQPQIIRDIHRAYFEAGADIVETNTFNGTSIAMADYQMEDLVYELNFESTKIAKKLNKKYKPNIIMEIGSNDGVFIKNFQKEKVIAVEPCKNLAKLTAKKYKTYPKFWDKKLSKRIFSNSKKADIIFSANTISHIPNLKETFDAIEFSLSKNGVLVIEDPSLSSVIKNTSYDQFYDEHVYVFSALSISNVVKYSKLRLFDADKIDTHGGSMRYYICKDSARYKKTKKLKKKKRQKIFQKIKTI